jgi:hypothetical protein
VAAAADILEPLSRASTPHGRSELAADPHAGRIRDRFNAAQEALKARADTGDGSDVLLEIQGAVAEALSLAVRGDLPAASAQLRTARLAAEDARLRLHQLCRHALSPDQLDQVKEAIRAQSADGLVDVAEIRERSHLMGCTLSARKASF